jgi:hypothetical protein
MNPLSNDRKVVLVVILLGVLLSVFFGIRIARFAMRTRFHPHPISTDVSAISGWMTIPYVSNIYAVPEPYLFEQIGLSPDGNLRSSLDSLNYKYFKSQPGIVLEKVQAAVSQFQQMHPASEKPLP